MSITIRLTSALTVSLLMAVPLTQDSKQSPHPAFDYDTARSHEIKPHRRTIPIEGAQGGFNQLHLTLTVSATGDVLDADPGKVDDLLKFWPQLQGEVAQWKFTPFEKDGKPVIAQVEEYIDLVPPERLPKVHVKPPVLRSNSEIVITLKRSGCFGTCPSYSVTVRPTGISFEGGGYVVAAGKHSSAIDASEVRSLAKAFIDADFYSMDNIYQASVTDNPTYMLFISIDGHTKSIEDYVGSWVGMPAVISELEDQVDEVSDTARWIKGSDGLVEALEKEKYNFKTFEAQVMLKEASTRGQTATVEDLLESGVPLKPIPAPKPQEPYIGVPFDHEGWLSAAASHPDTLQVFLDAEASKTDQTDKDLALLNAARSGKLESVRALIDYGAEPNTDPHKLIVTHKGAGMEMQGLGTDSVLIEAANSGNPELVREILRHHPDLESRDREGKTAIFAAGDYRDSDVDGARIECVRLLVEAGANVNARDHDGNTPLHETFLTDVEEELLKLGANVNARNKDGETPIFTTVDDDAIPLFIEHGADLTIRNKKGQTVVEAAKEKGPLRQEALHKAIEKLNSRSGRREP